MQTEIDHIVRDRVMGLAAPQDRALISKIAEQLDAIRNNRFGWADPIEDWLYDAANVLIQSVREHDGMEEN